uniref:Uncharacterized protein n=1 Tax=Lepeophtheirus salmonis TaxID=72036 RepID=A0A0K2VC31_LEPSM
MKCSRQKFGNKRRLFEGAKELKVKLKNISTISFEAG